MSDIKYNPFCELTKEEIKATGASSSFASFGNEDLWKAMEICFNAKEYETLVSISVSDEGVTAHFKTKVK